MEKFEPGKIINTATGIPATIVKYLASGGQGDVYIVEYDGKHKALKWYNPRAMTNRDPFYENLKRNAEKGSPDEAFLWPVAVTEKTDGSFGYIMDLLPDGYYALGKALVLDALSYKAAADACINIVNAFGKLHNDAYCYASIYDYSFFVEPKTGDVLIGDCDIAAPSGTNMGILGRPRYMAPEIVVGKGKVIPDIQSERHSLSVILFLILFLGHPLEGKRWLVPCMTDAIAEKLYGSDSLFIYDPNDNSNGPVMNIHENVMKRWGLAPQYLKDEFLIAFSQQALKDPSRRPAEPDWLKVLVRLRSDIVRCSCGNEVFIRDAAAARCDVCGKPVVVRNTIRLPSYTVAAAKGSRIYRCQLGTCDMDEALDPVIFVVAKPDGTLGVKNMTPDPLKAFTPSRKEKVIEPDTVIPFIPGISIMAYGETISLA